MTEYTVSWTGTFQAQSPEAAVRNARRLMRVGPRVGPNDEFVVEWKSSHSLTIKVSEIETEVKP